MCVCGGGGGGGDQSTEKTWKKTPIVWLTMQMSVHQKLSNC